MIFTTLEVWLLGALITLVSFIAGFFVGAYAMEKSIIKGL